jgi:hypothetical protein
MDAEMVCYLVGVGAGFCTGYLVAAHRYMAALARIFEKAFPPEEER